MTLTLGQGRDRTLRLHSTFAVYVQRRSTSGALFAGLGCLDSYLCLRNKVPWSGLSCSRQSLQTANQAPSGRWAVCKRGLESPWGDVPVGYVRHQSSTKVQPLCYNCHPRHSKYLWVKPVHWGPCWYFGNHHKPIMQQISLLSCWMSWWYVSIGLRSSTGRCGWPAIPSLFASVG